MVDIKISKVIATLLGLLAICLTLCGCAGSNAVVRNADVRNASGSLPLSASRIIDVSVQSKYTGKTMRCKVYFPKGYGDGREYPVWYGLNGSGSDEDMWVEAGLTASVDRLISDSEIAPLILVFPRTTAVTLDELQRDLADDGMMGERNMDRCICEEVVGYVDAHFDTVKNRTGRFIAGYSMGGMVALRVAFHHPDMFGKVAGYSPALLDSDFSAHQFEQWLYPNDDPGKVPGITALAVYLDSGYSSDPFYARVLSLHEALLKRGVSSAFHSYDGGHSLAHNNGDFGDYMRFFFSTR